MRHDTRRVSNTDNEIRISSVYACSDCLVLEDYSSSNYWIEDGCHESP